MKKVINGKMYNTETATELHFYENDCSAGDIYRIEETLFKKKTGEFFLRGIGVITPLSNDEAKVWSEDRLTGEKYEEFFGTVEE